MGRTLQRYKKLFEELKARAPHPLYFLYGPEEHIKKEFLSELLKKALGDENRAFNLDVLHGDEFERDVFYDRISSFPLFTERRVVVIKKFEAISTSNKDFVIEGLAKLPDTLVVVVEAAVDKLDTARLKSLDALAKDKGLSFRFQYLSDEETVERIKGRLRREGLAIEPQALDLLIASVGTHLIDLVNELEKIILSAGDETVLTQEMVAEVVGKYRTENLFAFLDHLGGADIGRVVKRMNRVIDSGEEPVFVMAMIIRRVLQLMQLKYLDREQGSLAGSPQAIAGKLGGMVSPFYVSRLVEQSRRFDLGVLHDYLDNLRWADTQLKSSSLPPRSLIEASLLASHIRKKLALNVN